MSTVRIYAAVTECFSPVPKFFPVSLSFDFWLFLRDMIMRSKTLKVFLYYYDRWYLFFTHVTWEQRKYITYKDTSSFKKSGFFFFCCCCHFSGFAIFFLDWRGLILFYIFIYKFQFRSKRRKNEIELALKRSCQTFCGVTSTSLRLSC